MYGLPEDFDASFFVGLELGYVTYSVNTVCLIFGKDVSISIESSFQHQATPNEADAEIQHVPITTCSDLMQLLGRSVEAVNANADGTLTLTFSGGHVFRCFDDASGYESYSIEHGGERIIV